ncbi:MAG: 30S ribosomal protein S5 [Candidatus Wildermuthbacteria bacterium RIFCSPHIGHO2_01_FULL_47_27]|uniref:Small ribosomal subunit protein uS5 n=2 Tax=Candidatus Wildermuthiibacteriota TaxID=1817923 RepID=A0A1G2RM82_9BACT|nr:MAG: 30S ribosomal protein S5 [Parcubacteria group bacterium GW2011_GWA2_47_9]OHA63223.1 MAG: 30S ribosomal protein S5 [Candidatus Wildermuthbacteria bacterium RIFCSPHIGHO2_01_FULL_47_27]OHA67814.1 MAG: 30S ribosomal protein S5 [Candidatus Wildermuthbacteria bacterium RIFCSPHIGHO2_02_FULL_47_17]OHA73963.1 MAG: 30S ribosomal protein S5 [Candidatus Wildermuthbacteria bacterium RIFCSPLOWO2_01_FULL_48_35]OHA74798.1 MAG: 30S ribosomal protein S5 [Candidatus Wildermuthbacteria bacterium RIFCSPLOWO
MQRRGQYIRDIKKDEFDSKLLDLARVTHVRAGGKRLRFRAVVVVGDRAGRVGLGVAKGRDVAKAVEKATRFAKKYLIRVPISEGTIPHEVYSKFGSARVLLKPQRRGRGLAAGGTVRVVCALAGIRNVSSKILGRTGNKLNNAKATIEALKKLRGGAERRAISAVKPEEPPSKDAGTEAIKDENKTELNT